MKLEEMSREERSLLLFLETCAVDHGGKVNTIYMNCDDTKIIENWAKSGFIQYGRISSESITKSLDKKTNWVNLSDEAWNLAHQERKARFLRMNSNRSWKKTIEIREEN